MYSKSENKKLMNVKASLILPKEKNSLKTYFFLSKHHLRRPCLPHMAASQ